ncbi:MAG: hypothetical protein MZW92_67985 [Comamonadaceae bacterium]|nr:hypothetical protein [Comamonadaceae bacterium]
MPGPLAAQELDRLKDLLSAHPAADALAAGTMLLVTPRLGTISPWSSKATDIARNCGLDAVRAHRARHRLSRARPARQPTRTARRARCRCCTTA